MLKLIQLHIECSCWFRHFCSSCTPLLQANDKKCIVMARGRFLVKKRQEKMFEPFLVLPFSVRCCHTVAWRVVVSTSCKTRHSSLCRRLRLSFSTTGTTTTIKTRKSNGCFERLCKGFLAISNCRMEVKLLQRHFLSSSYSLGRSFDFQGRKIWTLLDRSSSSSSPSFASIPFFRTFLSPFLLWEAIL